MNFNLASLPRVIFGEGVSSQTGAEVSSMGIKKVIFIYDKGVKDAGLADGILNSLEGAGISAIPFDKVLPDAPDTLVEEAAALARNERVEGIVCIGGGSAMDTAKSVNVLMGNPGSIRIYYNRNIVQKPGIPLILIPTTAGTGSEVSTAAIITDESTGVKRGFTGLPTTAQLAIADPALTVGLPPGLTAGTGMDAFSHAAESLTAGFNANPVSEAIAEKAISMIVKALPAAVSNGKDMAARSDMMAAAMMAAMAFTQAPPHLAHSIAHILGAKYHIHHGVGCAVSMPIAFEYVADARPEQIRRLGKAMGLDLKDNLNPKETAAQVADAIRDFNKQIGIPPLRELNIPEADLAEITGKVMMEPCSFIAPKVAMPEPIFDLLKKEYARSK